MRFIISIIESIYIIYMFNYFKTSIYLSHPFDIFTKKIKFIDHSEKENHTLKTQLMFYKSQINDNQKIINKITNIIFKDY